MTVRLRCLNSNCRHEFVRPESIVELDTEDYMRQKQCPECRSDATTLADVQPRPGLWWSDTQGLVQQLPRRFAGDELRFKVGYQRVVHKLPEDAVPLMLVPDRDKLIQAARDEYSMIWENSGKRTGDHDRALRHAIDVAVFGAEPMPDPGDLQQWMVEGVGILDMKFNTFPTALSRLLGNGRQDVPPEAKLLTRLRDAEDIEWGPWLPADRRTGQLLCTCSAQPDFHHDGPIALTDGRICGRCYGREGSDVADRRRKTQREGQRWR